MPKKRTTKKGKSPRRSGRAAGSPRKHPGYRQLCGDDQLIDEFGEEGAQWLIEEYQRPLTVDDLRLEQGIRRDAFVLDDPLRGPSTSTAQQIGQMIDMTLSAIIGLASVAGTLTVEQAREANELLADPLDQAESPADVVREAHEAGILFLNERGMWDLT